MKSVAFSERSALHVVANLSECSNKHDLWYTPNELRRFKAHTKLHARVVQCTLSSRSKSKPRLCTDDLLGLEKLLTPALATEHARRRDHHAYGVLRESRRGGAIDAGRLARMSAASGAWAAERARAAALFLERDQEDETRRCPWSRKLREACEGERARRRLDSRQETMEPRGKAPNPGCWC